MNNESTGVWWIEVDGKLMSTRLTFESMQAEVRRLRGHFPTAGISVVKK